MKNRLPRNRVHHPLKRTADAVQVEADGPAGPESVGRPVRQAAKGRRATVAPEGLITSLSEVIRDLYYLSRTVPTGAFKALALQQIERIIPFDSAMWGTGTDRPHALHNVYLDRQPAKMIEIYQARYQQEDFLRDAVNANPGTTINLHDIIDPQEWRETRIYREFTSRFGIECVLCTSYIDRPSSLISFLSLWRKDPQRPFSERERLRKQALMPHIFESHRANQAWFLRGKWRPQERGRAVAICDGQGVVHQSVGGFVAVVSREWPHWSGGRLPQRLVESVGQSGEFAGRHVLITISPLDDLYLLEARPRRATDSLAAREKEVALRYSRGDPYTSIAEALHLSPATVRTQLRRIYRKLGVTNKVELAQRLHDR